MRSVGKDMARISKETLKNQIKKAEEKVIRTGEAYNKACDELKELRAKEKAIEHEELIEAFIKSCRSYERLWNSSKLK